MHSMAGSQNIRQKKARHKRVYAIQVHSYEVLGLAKLIYGARNQRGKGHRYLSGGAGNALYLDLGGGYPGV